MDEAIDVCGVSGGNSDLAVESTEGGDTKCTELHAKDEPENILTQSSRQPDSPDGSRKRQATDSIQTHLQVSDNHSHVFFSHTIFAHFVIFISV